MCNGREPTSCSLQDFVGYDHLSMLLVLFFNQKTAYEMRISDWSSDVCSSDLSWCSHSVSPPKPSTITPDSHSIGETLPIFIFDTSMATAVAAMKAAVAVDRKSVV